MKDAARIFSSEDNRKTNNENSIASATFLIPLYL